MNEQRLYHSWEEEGEPEEEEERGGGDGRGMRDIKTFVCQMAHLIFFYVKFVSIFI